MTCHFKALSLVQEAQHVNFYIWLWARYTLAHNTASKWSKEGPDPLVSVVESRSHFLTLRSGTSPEENEMFTGRGAKRPAQPGQMFRIPS